MAGFIAIPTLAGQAAMAAAMDPENPVPIVLSKMIVGDGNGNAVTPVETMTTLVNERAEVPIAQTARDGNKLTIDGILTEDIGGFTVREIGVEDADGVLLFVAGFPATEKALAGENVVDELTVGMIVVVSDTAQVILNIDGLSYASHDYVNQAVANLRTHIGTPLRPYHLAVKSMALAIPPASPSPGDTYIIAADAQDAWAGHSGKLTQYVGAQAWVFVNCPNGQFVGNEADGLLYQRIGNAWAAYMPAHPGPANKRLWLHWNGSAKGWSDPFDINGKTTRAPVASDTFAFHDISVGEISKSTLGSLAAIVAEADYLHSEIFFLGSM